LNKITPNLTEQIQYSFVLIGRNCQDTILDAIQGIRKQFDKSTIEIIYVDDNSSDNSFLIARKKSDLAVKNESRIGIAASRLIGIKRTKFDRVFILDADILLRSINLDEINELFSKDVFLVTGKYESKDNKDFNRVLDARRRSIYGKDKKRLISHDNFYFPISGGFCVVRKHPILLNYLGKTDTASEDTFLQTEIINKGLKVAYLPSLTAEHKHRRTLSHLIKKVLSETRGYIWILELSNKSRMTPPALEQAFSFPIFLLMALITNNPFSLLLLFVEYIPQIISLIRNPSLVNINLFLLAVLSSLARLFYSLRYLLLNLISLPTAVRTIWYYFYSDFVAKKNWLNLFLYNLK